jgi:proline racemase/trans-L-3-hydroxyproline dehydratase
MDTIRTVDYHTACEPFRIVVGGVPRPPGGTVLRQRAWAREHLDGVRRLLVEEPRGHTDMYGCFVTDSAVADLGVVFFHNEGYSTACGHGTIALVTWALESGRLASAQGEVEVTVEVPSGVLRTWATVRGGDVPAVRFHNVPSFVLRRAVTAAGCTVDVAFGGAFYAIAPAPVPIDRAGLGELVERARAVRAALNRAGDVVHPLEPELRDVYGVMWTDGARNVTVFADGAVDRSPCGSGTSARLALLDATGELPRGRPLRHESVVATVFEGRVVGDAEVAGIPAVITEVGGSAHLTGRHEFVLEPDDPLGPGFLLR